MKDKKGFTLVELLAVIVVLAVIMTLAIPAVIKVRENAMKGLSKQQVDGMIEAGKVVGIDLDDYDSEIYNCKSSSWIATDNKSETDASKEDITCDKDANGRWTSVTISVEKLVKYGYFEDEQSRCSGSITIMKKSDGSGYTVTTSNDTKC